MEKISEGFTTSNEAKLKEKILSSMNPFTGTIVRSVWEDTPDVESINKSLTDQVLQLLKDAEELHLTKVMLVLGQAGIGKTHFISRLRRLADKGDFLFVAVKPISDVTTIFNHIYRETFTSLRKKIPDEPYTPMESLISHIVTKTLLKELNEINKKRSLPKKILNLMEKLEKEHTLIFKLIESDPKSISFFNSIVDRTIQSIERQYPEVDLTFLKVLFKALDPKLRSHAVHWLQGDDIWEEDLKLLGVRNTINNDQIAQRVLYSVMTLSDRPILFCFDQLESIYDRFGDPTVVLAFFDTIVRLCNETPNALILLMTLSSSWNDQIEPLLQTSAKDRIEYRDSLQTLSLEQVKELVEKRLNPLWGLFPYPPDPITYPFSSEYLRYVGNDEGWNPRGVIRTLAQDIKFMKENNKIYLLKEPIVGPEPPEKKSINEFIRNQMTIFMSKFSENFADNPYSTRENFLEAGLYDLFKGCRDLKFAIGKYEVKDIIFKKKPRHLDIIIHFLKDEKVAEKWGIEICNGENSATIRSVINRIQKHLDTNQIDRWIIIRDIALPMKKTWVKTNEMINSLSNRGRILFIDTVTNVKIFAIKELLDLSSAGDLEFENSVVTRKELLPFLVRNILPEISIIEDIFEIKVDVPEGLPTPKTKSPREKDLKALILEKAQSTMFLHIQKMFPDFYDKEATYRKVITKLIKQNEIMVLTEDEEQLVVSLAPKEDYF